MAPLSSTHTPQVKIPATYMRGGTSKGVFFRLSDLPERCQQPGPARDALFLRVIGSPDPYGAHMDGMGGATSSTAKCVILSKSQQPDHDVDYLYGQVAIDKAFVDWSGNCGNLSTGAGAFAIHAGLVDLVALQRMRGMEACQGGLLMTDLAGVNCYFFQVKRGYANASRQVKEAVEHNALYCSLFHGLAGQVGCPVCRQGDWNLLYGPSYQQAVEADLAGRIPSLRQLLAEIKAEEKAVLKQILLDELGLPLLPDDLAVLFDAEIKSAISNPSEANKARISSIFCKRADSFA